MFRRLALWLDKHRCQSEERAAMYTALQRGTFKCLFKLWKDSSLSGFVKVNKVPGSSRRDYSIDGEPEKRWEWHAHCCCCRCCCCGAVKDHYIRLFARQYLVHIWALDFWAWLSSANLVADSLIWSSRINLKLACMTGTFTFPPTAIPSSLAHYTRTLRGIPHL